MRLGSYAALPRDESGPWSDDHIHLVVDAGYVRTGVTKARQGVHGRMTEILQASDLNVQD